MKTLVNTLTLARILLATILAAVLLLQGVTAAIPTVLFFAICLTDFLDGRLARKFSAASRRGAIFDVIADLYYMLSVTGVLIFLKLLPYWFIIVILIKFIEFTATSWYIKSISGSEEAFISDKIGRSAAAMFYAMPYVSIVAFQAVPFKFEGILINLVCLAITALSAASTILRVKSCITFPRPLTVKKNRFDTEAAP